MNDKTNQPDESERWESQFRQWGDRPQPEPRPFFYTRLRARLDGAVESAEWLPIWLRRPAYAYAALGLLVLLNVGAAVGVNQLDSSDEEAVSALTTLQDDYPVDEYLTSYE